MFKIYGIDLVHASDEFIQQAMEELQQEQKRRAQVAREKAMADFKVAFHNLANAYSQIYFEDYDGSVIIYSRDQLQRIFFDADNGQITLNF